MTTLPRRIDLINTRAPGSIGAEIGVWRGYFSIEILNHTRIGKLYLVDAWKPQPSYDDPLSDTDHEANLAECKRSIRGHLIGGRVQIVRGDSLQVADHDRTIPPLDWVYIDANHSYEACLADLIAWAKRLKPRGVLMGHDYTDTHPNAIKWGFGVVRAVTEFCRDYGWTITAVTSEDFPSFMLEQR